MWHAWTGSGLRLLIVFPSIERGGAEGYALTMARAALHAGWQVEVASPPAEGVRDLLREFEQAGAVWHALRIGRAATLFGRRPRPLVPILAFIHSLRILWRIRPDALLIVLPGPAACFPTQLAAAALGLPGLCCFQLTPRVPWQPSAFRRCCAAWARARGQRWVCVSQHNREYVSRAFRVEMDSLAVIPNGATFAASSIDPFVARSRIRECLGIPGTTRIILTVARLGIQKAHAVLLEAIPNVVASHPDAHFVWLGEGEQRAALSARVAELGLTRQVHMPGFQNDIPDWLLAADIFAFPTHYEGLPFSLVEAMAAGLPVAASHVSSIPEILEDGKSGVLVDNTVEGWTTTLNTLLSEDARCETLRTRARLRARDFDESRMTQATLKLLEACAKGGA